MISIDSLPEQNRFSYSMLAKIFSVSISALKLASIKLNIEPHINDRGVSFLSREDVRQIITHLNTVENLKTSKSNRAITPTDKTHYNKCYVCKDEFNGRPIKKYYKSLKKVFIFCSSWCASNIKPRSILRYSEFRPSRVCKQCNDKFNFKYKDQLYCSQICASRFRTNIKRKSISTTCSNPKCKKPLEKCESYFKRANAHYCSNICKYGHLHINGKENQKSQIVTINCKACGEPFRYLQSMTSPSTRKYCSLKCSRNVHQTAK